MIKLLTFTKYCTPVYFLSRGCNVVISYKKLIKTISKDIEETNTQMFLYSQSLKLFILAIYFTNNVKIMLQARNRAKDFSFGNKSPAMFTINAL